MNNYVEFFGEGSGRTSPIPPTSDLTGNEEYSNYIAWVSEKFLSNNKHTDNISAIMSYLRDASLFIDDRTRYSVSDTNEDEYSDVLTDAKYTYTYTMATKDAYATTTNIVHIAELECERVLMSKRLIKF